MEKFVFQVFDLRVISKVNNAGYHYLMLEKASGPRRGQWHVTIPLTPWDRGPDAGVIRPHVSRRRGKRGRKERRGLDPQSYEFIPVKGEEWDGVLKFTPEQFFGFVEKFRPMVDELNAVAHYHEQTVCDTWLRQHLEAVYVPDPELEERFRKERERHFLESGRFVLNDETLRERRRWLEQCWQPADQLGAMEPGSPEKPILLRFRCEGGHVHEAEMYRTKEGHWIDRHYCPGSEDERREITERYLGEGAQQAFERLDEMLGFVDCSGDETPS